MFEFYYQNHQLINRENFSPIPEKVSQKKITTEPTDEIIIRNINIFNLQRNK